ncbi:hypothetical protein MTO96_039305 [Rhipicephalus appendiculatus]
MRLTCLDEQFRRHFCLTKETVWWLCDEVADELKGSRPTALSVERQVLCALRFFATGSFRDVGGKRGDRSGDAARGQQLCATCGSSNRQRRDPQQVGSLPEDAGGEGGREEKIPSAWTSIPASSDALTVASSSSSHPRGEQKASFWCCKGYYDPQRRVRK